MTGRLLGRVARGALVALVAMTLAACGSVQTYRFPLGAPSMAPTVRPAVFFEGNSPARQMEEVAIVEAVATGTKAEAETVIGALVEQTLRFGADAVVRVQVTCYGGECHGYGVAVRLR